MSISTKGRYGLEALLVLAIHSSEGHVNIKSIAERYGKSEAYILQIFLTLRKAGIVESIRGAQGGYRLAKEPAQITVGDILNVLEGPLAPVTCIIQDTKQPCDRYENCATRVVWEKIRDSLNKVVNAITIADLLQNYREANYRKVDLEYYL